MEHCDVFVAIHIAVEKDAPAQRVLHAAWPDMQFIDRVADLSNNTLPQIVEKCTTCSNMDGSIQESTSTCWNFEQLSMGSSGVYGPHQTFIPKGSLQWIRW